ncbi:hypothetical protein ACF1BQ_033950 [Bradyrhizobium sp. RDT10]
MAFNLRAAFAAAIGIGQVSANRAISEAAFGNQRERALLVVANQAVLTGGIRRRTAVKGLFTLSPLSKKALQPEIERS